MGQVSFDRVAARSFERMAEIPHRRVLCQPQTPPEEPGPSTSRVIVCSRRSRGGPHVKVEVKLLRSPRRGNSASRSCICGSRSRLRSVSRRGWTISSSSPSSERRPRRWREAQEVERQSEDQVHDHSKPMGMGRIITRPKFLQASCKPEAKMRTEQQLEQQQQPVWESRSLRSRGSVPRRSPMPAHFEERQRETDRDRQRQTETDRETDRDRQRERQRQTETQIETDRDRQVAILAQVPHLCLGVCATPLYRGGG